MNCMLRIGFLSRIAKSEPFWKKDDALRTVELDNCNRRYIKRIQLSRDEIGQSELIPSLHTLG